MIRVQDDIKTSEYFVQENGDRTKPNLDEPDKLPRDLSISYWELIALVLAIVSHIIDVCIDFNVAYQYYRYEKITYFVLTIVFIAVPSIINTYMSLKMLVIQLEHIICTHIYFYIGCMYFSYALQDDIQRITRKLLTSRVLLPFLLILQMAPVLRYVIVKLLCNLI